MALWGVYGNKKVAGRALRAGQATFLFGKTENKS